jgi:hypothetical protein
MSLRGLATVALVGAGGLLAWAALNPGHTYTVPGLPGGLPDLGLPDLTGTVPSPGAPQGAPKVPAGAPRGIRNNNPTNILAGLIPWIGQVGTDGAYIIFSAPLYGLRAAFRDLGNAHLVHGIATVRQVAQRWAPASANDPAAYAANVASYSGLPATAALDFNSEDQMTRLVRGMIGAENGGSWVNFYPPDLMHQAWGIRL